MTQPTAMPMICVMLSFIPTPAPGTVKHGSCPLVHTMAEQFLLELGMLPELLGSLISLVNAGVLPRDHAQQGSPSSIPFDRPSPSLSVWHMPVVQAMPAP